MADIYWLEQKQECLPETNDWLGPGELLRLNSLLFLKRRTDWRLGRWTAKCAFASLHQMPLTSDALAQIEICAAPSGAPQVSVAAQPQPVTISISHSSESAICAIAAGQHGLGCDLEAIEPHSDAFRADYFTAEEQDLVARAPLADRARLTTLLWSAKESALKALQVGLRADTRSVAVQLSPQKTNSWTPLRVHTTAGDLFRGWWCEENCMIRTIVAAFAETEPIPLPSHTEAHYRHNKTVVHSLRGISLAPL